MRGEFKHQLLGEAGYLDRKQGAHAKRAGGIADAAFPEADVGADAVDRISGASLDFGYTGGEFGAVLPNQRADQIQLRREMVVNAWLTDADCLGDIGVAEAAVATGNDQRSRASEYVAGGRARCLRHGICLPTSR